MRLVFFLILVFIFSCSSEKREGLSPVFFKYSKEDFYLAWCVLASECDVCSFDEQMLITSTFMNRSRIYGKSIIETIEEKNQFHINKDKWNSIDSLTKRKIVAAVYSSFMYGPTDSTVTHFWRRNDPPIMAWMKDLEIVHYKKYHVFAKAKLKIN